MKKKRFKFRFFRLSAGLFCYRTIWLRLFDSDCLPDYFSNNLPDCLPNGLLSNCFSNYFVRLFVGLFFELLSRLSAWLKTVSNFIQWNRFFGFQLKLWNVEPERLRMILNANLNKILGEICELKGIYSENRTECDCPKSKALRRQSNIRFIWTKIIRRSIEPNALRQSNEIIRRSSVRNALALIRTSTNFQLDLRLSAIQLLTELQTHFT